MAFFFGTSRGKGACDGLGGMVKRFAARGRDNTKTKIVTPLQLYEWARVNIPSTVFAYCSTEEYLSEKSHLDVRFKKSQTIPGTRCLHSFIPKSSDTLTTRKYSCSFYCKDEKVIRSTDLDIGQI